MLHAHDERARTARATLSIQSATSAPSPSSPFAAPAPNPFAAAAPAPSPFARERRPAPPPPSTFADRAARAVASVTVSWGEYVLGTATVTEGTITADPTISAPELSARGGRVPATDGVARQLLTTSDKSILVAASGADAVATRPLAVGDTVRLDVGELTVVIEGHSAAPAHREGAWTLDSALLFSVLGTAVVAATVLASAAYAVPPLGMDDGIVVSQDKVKYMQRLLDLSAEREQERKESEVVSDAAAAAGAPDTPKTNAEPGSPAPPLRGGGNGRPISGSPAAGGSGDRAEVLAAAAEFGMIGVLASAGGRPMTDNPFGDGVGPMEDGASGLWASDLGDTTGTGLFLGDGPMFGSPLGVKGGSPFGTIGVPGRGPGAFGSCRTKGPGCLAGKHVTAAPQARIEILGTTTSGRLPAEVIRRTVRQQSGRFLMCYQAGVQRDPSLAGRVVVNFIINDRGAVSSVVAGGDLPDAAVVSCVQQAFYGLSFQAPEGGIVSVSYPISFSPQ